MNLPIIKSLRHRGFALISTLVVMSLIILMLVGMLSLSSIEVRRSNSGSQVVEAQANARMALMIALGELQKEMGPDMRISATSSILDSIEDTEEIDGVAHSQWLGVYDSWGNWLSDNYTPPGKGSLSIQNTYTKGRVSMFRHWLLSLPTAMQESLDSPLSVDTTDPKNWVTMVGVGSLGNTASENPDQVTKAYLTGIASPKSPLPNGIVGKYAWWIGPENQKAKVTLAKQERNLSASESESSSGNTAEVGVGIIGGLEALDDTTDASKILTLNSTELVDGISQDAAKEKFFDLTATSMGLLTSVRTGHLKKDLSLLFEYNNASLPEPYKFDTTDIQEPSIRPMSSELAANNPHIPIRHFQSWTNMRHFYRMYREFSDANTGGAAGTGGVGSLRWDSKKPWADTASLSTHNSLNTWNGSNNYWRFPIVAKLTFIYSLMTKPSTFGGRYELYVVYTPVFTYWNPYNVELRIPDKTFGAFTGAPRVWPVSAEFFTRDPLSGLHKRHAINNTQNINYSIGSPTGRNNVFGWLSSGDGSDIVFQPGQFRVFSLKNYTDSVAWGENHLVPGFDPLGIEGGDMLRIPQIYYQNEQPAMSLRFGIGGWVFNMNNGNTPGSLCLLQSWGDRGKNPPMMYQHDWLRADANTSPRLESEGFTQITLDPDVSGDVAMQPGNLEQWVFDGAPRPIAFIQLVMKGATPLEYDSIDWARKDWRSRNWIQSPPNYFGGSLYISEDESIANTQRWDDSYSMNFGPLFNIGDAVALVDPFTDASIAKLGSGTSPVEQVSEAAVLELPSAPISSLAGFDGMRINPGWVNPQTVVDQSSNPKLRLGRLSGQNSATNEASAYSAEVKLYAYQSGVTGPGIGNSFMHPMLERTNVYRDFDNSKSMDPIKRDVADNYQENDLKVFRDYWDHVFLLNEALWDDYFLSSLATQARPSDTSAVSLSNNIKRLTDGDPISNSRYTYYSGNKDNAEVESLLSQADGYLKAAGHLFVDGMFNVNSTSVSAWYALFAGIRERKAVFRNASGQIEEIAVPADKRIALTRFNTETSDQEMEGPELGADMPSGWMGWSGVRFLDDDQLYKLAEECVKQVKMRGPFLNVSEFINRRLSDDALGTMGALQSAIDYDDESPTPGSINYMFKSDSDYMIAQSDLTDLQLGTPEAAAGSRFAGIPGYVIQSDILKPIGNTLAVRDDTFRIRAYGEKLDGNGDVVARAWCEAIVQRVPEYIDPTNDDFVATREIDARGDIIDNPVLSEMNRLYGRKFQIKSFRWLDKSEI